MGTESAAGGPGGVPAARLVRRVEERLERLLESGWRNAGQEASQLTEEAEALALAGMERLAQRLREVAAAQAAADGLAAVTVALAACRLLRARLAPNPLGGGQGEWSAVGEGTGKRKARRPRPATEDRLIPVGRMTMGKGEGWACLRLKGPSMAEWVLVEPFELPEGARALRTKSGVEPVWLRSVLRGRLRWRARLPLGAEGSVERCALEEGTTVDDTDAEGNRPTAYRLVDHVLETLKGSWKDGMGLLGGYGNVRLARLDPAESAAYVWADEAAAGVLQGCSGEVWGVVWKGAGAEQPLALLSPKGLLKRAAVMHLVPGRPTTPLE